MSEAYECTTSTMGTVVSVRVVGGDPLRREERTQRALRWFARVEAVCSRFEPDSELCQLCERVGQPVKVSALLFEVLKFAVAVAEASGGAFDPTLGALSAARGFDRHWRTGVSIRPQRRPSDSSRRRRVRQAGWRALTLDEEHQTVMLRTPMQLDLGAVAKGMAVDLAARDLADVRDFAIDAGGDVYVSGSNHTGQPWSVGIRNPQATHTLCATLRVRDRAVCTSGDYARTSTDGVSTHLIDPATGGAATSAISATVVAPTAMVADALATAVYIMGPVRGLALLEHHGADGLIIATDSTHVMTSGMAKWIEHPVTNVA